jgi:SAM-dependent methyltransferase
MRPTIDQLLSFYHSKLGKTVSKCLVKQVLECWPDCTGLSVAGLGFPLPVLSALYKNSERTIALMPARQGASTWTPTKDTTIKDQERPGNLSAMVESSTLPLPDLSVDRLILLHLVEHTVDLHASMREAWRVLRPEGRLIVVVPNRASIWVRVENNPFAYGRPFSRSQLAGILEAEQFQTLRGHHALFFPPSHRPMALRFANSLDAIGQKLMPLAGGVIVNESVKRVVIQPPKQKVRQKILQKIQSST